MVFTVWMLVWKAESGYENLSNNDVTFNNYDLKGWCQNMSYWLNICKFMNKTWFKKANIKHCAILLSKTQTPFCFCFWALCKKIRLKVCWQLVEKDIVVTENLWKEIGFLWWWQYSSGTLPLQLITCIKMYRWWSKLLNVRDYYAI